MLTRCSKCGMIRSVKDLVLLEDETFLCFLCWNKYNRERDKKRRFLNISQN